MEGALNNLLYHDGFDFDFEVTPTSTPQAPMRVETSPIVRRRTTILRSHELRSEINLSTQSAQFLCAGTAASISSFLYNPLDCLRIRWQVASPQQVEASAGLLQYGNQIVRSEGLVSGLWRPGLAANVSGMFLSAAIRFTAYENVRDSITSISGSSSKNGAHMFASGIICGGLAYFVTTPFHLLKTLRQAEKTRPSIGVDMRAKMLEFRHVLKGAVPVSLRGALFSSGQLLGYDGLKTAAKARGMEDGPYLHLLSSVAASFGASFLSGPADLLVARYMSTSNGEGLIKCIKDIRDENGIRGFWRGWSVSFLRLTPVMITYSTLYEQFRLRAGLGYLN